MLDIPHAPQVGMPTAMGGVDRAVMEKVRQDLQDLTVACKNEIEGLHESMEMLHGLIQQGGGQPGSDIGQLAQAMEEEIQLLKQDDDRLKQEMMDACHRVEQLWKAVEAISAESQNHRAELQTVREHGVGGGGGGGVGGAGGRGEVVNLPAPGGEPVHIPEGTEAGEYALQLICAVQEEFRGALEQERADVAQHVLGEREQCLNDIGTLRLEVGEAIGTEREERQQHEQQLRSELVEVMTNERNDRVAEQLEHRDETNRMFEELAQGLQGQGFVMAESADQDGQRSHADMENPHNPGFMSRLFRKSKQPPPSGECR